MTTRLQQRGAGFLLDPVDPEDIVCPEDMSGSPRRTT